MVSNEGTENTRIRKLGHGEHARAGEQSRPNGAPLKGYEASRGLSKKRLCKNDPYLRLARWPESRYFLSTAARWKSGEEKHHLIVSSHRKKEKAMIVSSAMM
jgi:hypothetical protein